MPRATAQPKQKIVGPTKPATRLKTRKVGDSGEKVYVVESNSPTIGQDILRVFREKVKAARRENMKAFGSADRVPAPR